MIGVIRLLSLFVVNMSLVFYFVVNFQRRKELQGRCVLPLVVLQFLWINDVFVTLTTLALDIEELHPQSKSPGLIYLLDLHPIQWIYC